MATASQSYIEGTLEVKQAQLVVSITVGSEYLHSALKGTPTYSSHSAAV